MKLFKLLLGTLLTAFILIAASSHFTSCTKTEIVRDTIIKKDTIIRKDTLRIVDSSNCNCYNLKDGLVAWYNFNGGSLQDSSGYGNHIIFNNAVKTADRFGNPDNAYLFNGTGSYMQVSNSSSLNPTNGISLMAIVKIAGYFPGNCAANQIVGKGYNDFIDGHYELRFGSKAGCNNPVDTSREVFFGAYGNYSSRSSATDTAGYIQTNKWYNVVYTYGNGQSKIYVNGILKNTVNQNPAAFTPNTQELYIGKHGDPAYPYWFNGVIDEVRIYNRILCQGEVSQLNKLTR